MLIINADDLGGNTRATDNILTCYRHGSLTSASAMVFMADAERAAELALIHNLPTGLHLNLTTCFDAHTVPLSVRDRHQRISTYLRNKKYSFLFYNPALKNHIDYVYKSQLAEYNRLYKTDPRHIDGHHHMHLCMNMLFADVIARGSRVRRNFSFMRGEKGALNRTYRALVDQCLLKRYRCTDFFFSITPITPERIRHIVELSTTADVELMVHPEHDNEYDYLLSPEFRMIVTPPREQV